MLQGFHTRKYVKRWPEFFEQISQWANEVRERKKNCVKFIDALWQLGFQGKLKHRETEYHGFEQMPRALIDQLNGKNIGKVIVHA